MSSREPILDEPVIVLTSARSGSTLLRLILDAHPDLACPPETNIVKACWQFASAFNVTCGDAVENVPDEALTGVYAMISSLFKGYLTRQEKIRWCDKSLGTAPMAAWFAEIYPKAKFICLYRHCMDVIHSGLEASPWGLTGYGFEQFAGLRSGSSLSALAAYWIEHTGRIAEFEKANSDRCLRVHYERLVEAPEQVADEIFGFLDVKPSPGITSRCLSAQVEVFGPGDHKIMSTRKITSDSVGRGIRIPSEAIPEPQLKVINHFLGELGYTQVDDAWRRSACPPVLLEAQDRTPSGSPDQVPVPASLGDHFAQLALEKISKIFQAKVEASFLKGVPAAELISPDVAPGFELVAYHANGQICSRSCRVDLANRSVIPVTGDDDGDSKPGWLVSGDVETWLAVLADRANMSSCLRSGALRYVEVRPDAQESTSLGVPGLLLATRTERRLATVRELLGLAGYAEEVGD
jgi:Sulfotransferase family